MRKLSLFLVCSICHGALDPAPMGFLPSNAARQLELESGYDDLLSADQMRDWMQKMTTRPHHAGSAKAKENAEFIAELFRSWGYEVETEVFYVLLPTPKTRELQLLRPIPFRPSLTERIIGNDSVAEALEQEGLPPYNAYSGEGEVVGPLVYVNQGVPEDYEVLRRHGIDVKGKIVIARYGGSWRGIKPKVAAEQGAIGCIIYNDPLNDGYAQGAAYPAGAYKHDTAVQRGSVIDLPVRPGDPLTPGYGATADAKRLPIDQAETIMKIPVLPISSVDAEPLFRTLDGPVAPADWRGALPVTYRLGGGQSIVRLKMEFNWDTVPAYNVIAKQTGSHYPDQWVIRGNHHDAWVIGARDPMSGAITVLEEARALAALMKGGWAPKRTILFCIWDAEEPGLLGSTEWVEHHADRLRQNAIAYINTDGNSRGFLDIGGSHTLETLAAQVADQVADPLAGVSVSERLRSARLVLGSAEEKKDARSRRSIRLNALGSGSDYSAFLQHLGVASFYVRFRGEGVGGEYHTCFDTFDHYSRFIDPEFHYAMALTKVCGRLTLRLAEADILPFDFGAFTETLSSYVDEVVELADERRRQVEELNTLVRENRFTQAADPIETFVPPQAKQPVPHVNFAPLLNARERLRRISSDFERAIGPLRRGERTASADRLAELNRVLYQSERTLIDPAGLPHRPWFRHRIYAPGLYTGYGVKTLPGVREAIEQEEWSELDGQIQQTAAAIERMVELIETATALVSEN